MARAHHTPTLPPRGLCREDAAAYVGIATTKFDEMVADGRMPKPVRIDGRNVWDRHAIDEKFDALGGNAKDANPWDQLLNLEISEAMETGRKLAHSLAKARLQGSRAKGAARLSRGQATLAKPGEKHATYGTVAWLVGEYFASLDFLGRPASMKVKHRRYIEDFQAGAAISRWRGSRPGIWRSCLPR